MVLRVQQAAGLLRTLPLQPMLVQLLDPRGIFGCLIPHHAVQSFHLLEELPALHIWSLELAPSIQAACGRVQGMVVGSQGELPDPQVWRRDRPPSCPTPSTSHWWQAAVLCYEELPEGQAMTST